MKHFHCKPDGQSRQRRHLVLGICFIVGGALALLNNLHVIAIGDVRNYWPLVFSVFGLSHVLRWRHLSSMIFGLGLILLGVGLTLQNLGLVQHVMSVLVPAFLILAGIAVLARGMQPQRPPGQGCCGRDQPSPSLEHNDEIHVSAVMSGTNLRCDSQDFKGGELSTIMGGIELDLRQASIGQSQALLRVNIVGGGLALKVPQDWQIVLHVSPILGGVENKTIPPMQADKTLVLQGDVILGGIEIKN